MFVAAGIGQLQILSLENASRIQRQMTRLDQDRNW